MDYSATFARHFARLVWLLMHEDASVDEQKMSLRALVTVSKLGGISLAGDDWQLQSNDQPVPAALTGVADVASQLAAHSIRRIRFSERCEAADLLGVARILAARADRDDGGAHALQKLSALGARSVEFVTVAPPAAPAPIESPASFSTEITEISPITAQMRVSQPVAEDASVLMKSIAEPDVSKQTSEVLLAVLDAARTEDACTRALDDLVLLAEHSVRAGKALAVADIFHGIVKRDSALRDDDLKGAFVMAIRRMSKPVLLRAVATLIAKTPERKQLCYEVLERAGEDGADAVIEQIAQATTPDDRRSLLEVLREMRDVVPALTRMLGDSRWFVVRNAADLLGEMNATDADAALIGVLRHHDDRVRRSATNALLRLGSQNAVKAIYDAVSDSSADVRMQAAAAIATRKDAKSSTTLIRAIEEERDSNVQLAMIAALGKVGTPDAVQKLVKMAEPEGRLFRKKTTVLRVAAVQALGDAKTPAAFAALKGLAADKEREVRDTATRALAHTAR